MKNTVYSKSVFQNRFTGNVGLHTGGNTLDYMYV